MNRRDFLCRSAGFTGLSAAPLSTWLSLQGMSQLAAQSSSGPNSYRAVVCLFLAGGNDCFNMLVPRPKADPTGNWSGATADGNGEDQWNKYCTKRDSVALGRIFNGSLGQAVLPLKMADGSLHPQALNGNMPRLQAIFNGESNPARGVNSPGRHAAFVCNVGTVVQPVTAAEVRSRSKILPLHLQSHANQIEQWQTVFPQGQIGTGWAGRLIDQLYASDPPPINAYRLISLDGTSLALTGGKHLGFTDSGASRLITRMVGASDYTPRRALIQDILGTQMGAKPDNLLTRAYLQSLDQGIKDTVTYDGIVTGAVPTYNPPGSLNTQHGLVDKMRRIAHIIDSFRQAAITGGTGYTGPRRQVFFVSLGGWDHHNGLQNVHLPYLDILDSALGEFYMLLKSQNTYNNGTALEDVTLFTASDFGRALVPNGDGSDHAWGSHHIVMGGAVNGGQIYGQYPQMKTMSDPIDDTNYDIYGNGVMVPTLSADQYMQRIGKWFLKGTTGENWSDSDPLSPWRGVLPNWGDLYNWSPANGLSINGLLS